MGLKRDSSTLTEWLCSISTHTRILTKLRGHEMVKGSICPRVRPPAALPGQHHPKAGPTPRPAPSFTFIGHLGNGLDHQYPQGCPRAKVTTDVTTGTAVPLGSFSSPVISPYGWLCPRSWWECHDQFQESHCWVKGFHTLAPGHLRHSLSQSSTRGAGGLPRTPLEAEGEDAGSSRQRAREKCGSGP